MPILHLGEPSNLMKVGLGVGEVKIKSRNPWRLSRVAVFKSRNTLLRLQIPYEERYRSATL